MLPSQKPPLKKWGFFGPSSKKNPPKKAREKGLKRKGYHQKTTLFKVEKTQKSPFQNISEKAQKKPWRPKNPGPKKMVSLQKRMGSFPKKYLQKLLANSPPSTMKF
jgi:hypothetical protein